MAFSCREIRLDFSLSSAFTEGFVTVRGQNASGQSIDIHAVAVHTLSP